MTEIAPVPVLERSMPEIVRLVSRNPTADCAMELQRKHSRLRVGYHQKLSRLYSDIDVTH